MSKRATKQKAQEQNKEETLIDTIEESPEQELEEFEAAEQEEINPNQTQTQQTQTTTVLPEEIMEIAGISMPTQAGEAEAEAEPPEEDIEEILGIPLPTTRTGPSEEEYESPRTTEPEQEVRYQTGTIEYGAGEAEPFYGAGGEAYAAAYEGGAYATEGGVGGEAEPTEIAEEARTPTERLEQELSGVRTREPEVRAPRTRGAERDEISQAERIELPFEEPTRETQTRTERKKYRRI